MAWQDLLATGFQSGGWQTPALIDSLSARARAAGKDGFDWGPAIETLLNSNGASFGNRAMWTDGSPAPSILDDILAAANGHNQAPWSDNPSVVNPNLLRTDPAEKAAAIASMQRDQSDNGSDGLGDIGKLAMLAATIYSGGSLAGLWGGAEGLFGSQLVGEFGFGPGVGELGGSGAWLGETGGVMDWWDSPSYSDSGGWESWGPEGGIDGPSGDWESWGPEGGVDGPSGDWETWDPDWTPGDAGGPPGSSNWTDLLKIGGSSLLHGLFGGNASASDLAKFAATGGTDWGKVLSGLMGYKMTGDLADKYFDRAVAIADKYKRPWDEWLPEARLMRDDPSQWMSTRWGGWANQVANEAARKSAAGGFNNSGTGANQIADTVLNRSAKDIYNPNYANTLQAAGLFQSPSTAASIEGDLTKGGLNLVNQANSNLGFAAREGTADLLGGVRGQTDDIYNSIMKTFLT